MAKTHKCPHCNKTFTNVNQLRDHVRANHKGTKDDSRPGWFFD